MVIVKDQISNSNLYHWFRAIVFILIKDISFKLNVSTLFVTNLDSSNYYYFNHERSFFKQEMRMQQKQDVLMKIFDTQKRKTKIFEQTQIYEYKRSSLVIGNEESLMA